MVPVNLSSYPGPWELCPPLPQLPSWESLARLPSVGAIPHAVTPHTPEVLFSESLSWWRSEALSLGLPSFPGRKQAGRQPGTWERARQAGAGGTDAPLHLLCDLGSVLSLPEPLGSPAKIGPIFAGI
jgi:hypothetical protein